MSSVGGTSRSNGSTSNASHGTSSSRSTASTHGTSATHATQGGTKAAHSKKTGHATQDTFEDKPQNATIKATVSQLNPEGNWRAKKGETFCNQFAAAYSNAMGDNTINSSQNANTQIESLANSPNYHVATAEEAKKAAADGKLAFATWSNPKGGHGHIAAVVGETGGKPAIAQAGAKNYNFAKVSLGFGSKHPPTYYVHN